MLSLAAIAVLVLHPNINKAGLPTNTGNDISFIENDQDLLAVLPTPLSAEVHEPQALPMSEGNAAPGSGMQSAKPNSDASSKLLYGSFVYKDWFGDRPTNQQHVTYRKCDRGISLYISLKCINIFPYMHFPI